MHRSPIKQEKLLARHFTKLSIWSFTDTATVATKVSLDLQTVFSTWKHYSPESKINLLEMLVTIAVIDFVSTIFPPSHLWLMIPMTLMHSSFLSERWVARTRFLLNTVTQKM